MSWHIQEDYSILTLTFWILMMVVTYGTYFHLRSLQNNDMTQVVNSYERTPLAIFMLSSPCLLLSWQLMESGRQEGYRWIRLSFIFLAQNRTSSAGMHKERACLTSSITHRWVSVNSLWPSDVIWWQGSGSTLLQVMAWCHQATRHYLKQC